MFYVAWSEIDGGQVDGVVRMERCEPSGTVQFRCNIELFIISLQLICYHHWTSRRGLKREKFPQKDNSTLNYIFFQK